MLEVWRAALHDAALACNLPIREAERTFVRLSEYVSSRGVGVFTLDLPASDECLIFLLENGYSHFQAALLRRKSKLDIRPHFMWELWCLVCDEKGVLLSDPCPDAIFAIRQLSCLFKKLEIDCSDLRQQQAVGEFYAIENDIWVANESWHQDSLVLDSRPSLDKLCKLRDQVQGVPKGLRDLGRNFTDFARRFDKIAGILVSGLGLFDTMSADSPETGFFKHGPGAVSNLKGREYKYSFPNWSESLEWEFPFDWCSGSPLGSEPLTRESPKGRLLAVPKTAKGPRLIASEPVEHQWCQQKIATFLACRYDSTRIGKYVSLRNQSLSQRLVVSASLDQSLSTIDLSSASDRIATWHIEALMACHPQLLHAMHAVRTRYLEDGVTDRALIRLNKFSTMGSALTFPIQSLLFLVIALASCDCDDLKGLASLEGKVRVFGDDIIVPSKYHVSLVENLTYLGLKVNTKKSFVSGFFRESCGMDSWRGYDITPAKPKTLVSDAVDDLQALMDVTNNLWKKGYWHLSKAIERYLPYQISKGLIVSVSSTVPALMSFAGTKLSRERWNPHLHRHETILFSAVKRDKRVTQDNSFALREFLTRPWRDLHPRQTGTKRTRATVFVARWVASYEARATSFEGT
jgi:hypothetical protein